MITGTSQAILAPGACITEPPPEIQLAGASAGPFTSANYHRDPTAGVGPNFLAGVGALVTIYKSSVPAANQVIWCFNDSTTSGWRIQYGAGGSLNILFNNTARQLSNMKMGGNQGFFYRRQDGSLWGSLNGSLGTQLVAAPTYTNGSASAVHAIGRSIAPNTPATVSDILNCLLYVRLSGDYTPAEMAEMTNGINENNRWQVTSSALSDSNLFWGVIFEQWNGLAGNLPTIGSNPSTYIMTVQGTGGGKNTLPAYDIWTIPNRAVKDNAYNEEADDGTPIGTIRRSIFSRILAVTNVVGTTHYAGITVDAVNSDGNASGHPSSANCGILVNGSTIVANDNTTLAIQEDGILRSLDATGIPTGSDKIITVIPGFEQWPGNYTEVEPIKGSYPQRIRVVQGNDFSWGTEDNPDEKLIILGDGHICEVEDNPNIISPCYQAWPILARTNAFPKRVGIDGWFSRTLWTVVGGSVYTANSIDRISRLSNGVISNKLYISMGVSDYNHVIGIWPNLTELHNYLGDWLDNLHIALPNLLVFLSTGIPAAFGTDPNAEGWTVPEMRTTYSNVCVERSSYVTYVDDSLFVTGAGIAISGNYYTVLGHQQYEAGYRLVVGY